MRRPKALFPLSFALSFALSHSLDKPMRALAVFAAMALAAGALAGCTPSIGDKCVLSTDCSTRGDRLCDTSQPDGYCTEFNCAKNTCPDKAVCVLFNAAVPGCGYDDRSGGYGSRIARSFCIAMCSNNGDCRSGYVCADPHSAPFNGLVQDDDQSKRTCLVAPPGYGVDAGADAAIASYKPPAPVCNSVAPDVPKIDASAARIDDDSGVVTPPLLMPDSSAPDASDAGDAGDGGD